jgi:8-oxo-dGTP pyrophosphatase MutT (NUDIX family)
MTKPTTEFLEAKRKFDSLRDGVFIGQDFVTLQGLLNEAPSPYFEPEWGFPKGRRKLHENDKDCALREFCEETGIPKEYIHILDHMAPFEEIFFGTNNVLYRHSYYIARMEITSSVEGHVSTGTSTTAHSNANTNYDHIDVDPTNIHQVREVGAVEWFTFEDVLSHIREHNQERKRLFRQVHQKVMATIA